MIGRLIVADQKIAMLKPLLHDRDLIEKWDGSHGAHGLNLLNMTLYYDLVRELAAISLDKDKKSPSIKNILKLLDSKDLLNHLKQEYCKPLPMNWINDIDEDSKRFWEEKYSERELTENEERFNNTYQEIRGEYKSLKESELFKKIRDARNKLIAHYEMRHDGEAPRMVNPTDFDLKWGDAEEYFELLKPIITKLILIISNEGYALDACRSQHEQIANEFWYK
jgi:AbiU2